MKNQDFNSKNSQQAMDKNGGGGLSVLYKNTHDQAEQHTLDTMFVDNNSSAKGQQATLPTGPFASQLAADFINDARIAIGYGHGLCPNRQFFSPSVIV